MNKQYVFAVFLVGAVVAGGVALTTGQLGSPLAVQLGGQSVDQTGSSSTSATFEPAVTDFSVNETRCDEQNRNTDLDTDMNDASVNITVMQNVEVPNSSATLAVGELTQNGSNYTLTLVDRDTDATLRDCTAQVDYNATVRLPEGRSDTFSFTVQYDGEVLTEIQNEEGETGASAST